MLPLIRNIRLRVHPCSITMAQASADVQISPNIDDADRVVASFHGKDPSQFTVHALKVWLASQGASTRGNKAQLVESLSPLSTERTRHSSHGARLKGVAGQPRRFHSRKQGAIGGKVRNQSATNSKSVSATECSIVGCQRVPFAVS